MRIVPTSFVPSPRVDDVSGVAASVPAYSATKFIALNEFVATASVWRVLGLLLLTPLPGLLSALLPAFVELQDPLASGGLADNPGFIAHAALSIWVCFSGILLHYRAGSGLPASAYSLAHISAVATMAAMIQTGFAMSMISAWRFPLPMLWIIGSSTIGISLLSPHLVVLGKRCWQDKRLHAGFVRYLPSMVFQCLQLVIYPAFSILFDRVSPIMQVVLTLVFPFVKYAMKLSLRRYTKNLEDLKTEVAVSGVEICASLYQSMIMQNSPSAVAVAMIMGTDVLQGLVTVKLFMDKRVTQTTRQMVVGKALEELRSIERSRPPGVLPHTDFQLKQSLVVAQALHIVDVAESIVLIEYFEVVIPIVNMLFLVGSQQFSSAQDNMRMRSLYFHPELLNRAIG